eukprot:Tbor_TRINITY_DN5191_c0_g1::TRINITY_DN5191_c0_g1_i1::g.25763::m.25763
MGHKSAFVKQRHGEHKQKHDLRADRSKFERNKRRTNDQNDQNKSAKGEKTHQSGPPPSFNKAIRIRVIPTDVEETQLLKHLDQSCRIPAASEAICNLIRFLSEHLFTTNYTSVVTTEEMKGALGRGVSSIGQQRLTAGTVTVGATKSTTLTPSEQAASIALSKTAKKRSRDEVREDREESEAKFRDMTNRLKSIVSAFSKMVNEGAGDAAENENNESEQYAMIADLISDECANRVMCTLLRCVMGRAQKAQMSKVEKAEDDSDSRNKESSNDVVNDEDKKNKDADAVQIKQAEERAIAFYELVKEDIESLATKIIHSFTGGYVNDSQHSTIKILSVIAEQGNASHQKSILKFVKQKVKMMQDEDEVKEDVNVSGQVNESCGTITSLLCDRALGSLVQKLLECHFRDKVVTWLNKKMLGLGAAEGSIDRIISVKQLLTLIEDKVAGNVLQCWVDDSNREFILFIIFPHISHLSSLLGTKRGAKFLAKLLSVGDGVSDQVKEVTVLSQRGELAEKILSRLLFPVLVAKKSDTSDDKEDREEKDDTLKNAANIHSSPYEHHYKKLSIMSLSLDINHNYVVQKVFRLIPLVAATNPKQSITFYNRVLEMLDAHYDKSLNGQTNDKDESTKNNEKTTVTGGGSRYHKMKTNKMNITPTNAVQELALSSIGSHALVALIEAVCEASVVINSSSKKQSKQNSIDVRMLLDRLLQPPSIVLSLLCDLNGGVVIRRLLGCIRRYLDDDSSSSCVSTILNAAEANMNTLIYDSAGNLVVQELLRTVSPAAVAAFFNKHVKGKALDSDTSCERAISMAKHQYASHVLFTLFDVLDAKCRLELCHILKNDLVNLSKHLNGRFVVEKVIPHCSDTRDILLTNFLKIALEKGTQHILLALWKHMDDKTAKKFINSTILPNLKPLATNAAGSLILQKLIQDSQQQQNSSTTPSKGTLCVVLYDAAVKNSQMKNELLRDFFGKFVIQVLTVSSF